MYACIPSFSNSKTEGSYSFSKSAALQKIQEEETTIYKWHIWVHDSNPRKANIMKIIIVYS